MKYKKREHEIPFRTFQPGKRAYLFRFSNGTNRRHVFHLLPNRDFRKLWLNGKRRPKFFISLIYKCFKASAKNSTNRTIMIITTSSPPRFMSVRWIRLISGNTDSGIRKIFGRGIRNHGKFGLWNPESWVLESEIQLEESRIPLTIGTQNTESKSHWQRSGIQELVSGIQAVESGIQIPLLGGNGLRSISNMWSSKIMPS